MVSNYVLFGTYDFLWYSKGYKGIDNNNRKKINNPPLKQKTKKQTKNKTKQKQKNIKTTNKQKTNKHKIKQKNTPKTTCGLIFQYFIYLSILQSPKNTVLLK